MQVSYLSWEDSLQAPIETRNIYSIETHPILLDSANELMRVYLDDQPSALVQFDQVKSDIKTITDSFPNILISEDADLNDLLVEIEWIVEEPIHDESDYIEAQLISYIRLVSARLAYIILNDRHDACWLDPRDIVLTDETWTKANVSIQSSQDRLKKLAPEFIYITTHGVGTSSDNQNTLTKHLRYWNLLVQS